MNAPHRQPVLHIVVCGAGPASDVTTLIDYAHEHGWDVYLTATPAGLGFLDVPTLEARTGYEVRSAHRLPGTPRRSKPPPDAVIVAPATSNTITKLAAGISDTYALDLLTEAIGGGIPVVVLPFVNTAYAARVPFRNAVAALRAEGVHVLLGESGFQPHPPHSGREHLRTFPWANALDLAIRCVEHTPERFELAAHRRLDGVATLRDELGDKDGSVHP